MRTHSEEWINARAAPKRNEPPPVTVNDTPPPPGELGALGLHGASLRGKAVAMLSPDIPRPVPSAGREGGMTPAATAAQGRARWGALGCRIRRGSSEEEAETREETGAAGVKEV
jgi:hypothetical protein